MADLLDAALEIDRFCRERAWPFCLIGGLALLRWGEPRATLDVDVSLLTGFGGEEKFVDELLQRFSLDPRMSRREAIDHRVVPVRSSAGLGIDIALAALPFEETAIGRATDCDYSPSHRLRTCSADDLVVMKAFAGRPKDWFDVESVALRQAGRLDWPYINAQLEPLLALKDAPENLAHLAEIRRRSDR
jgi:hypothetical protein